jgi:holo-[acyl-carrier protein] synthase
MTKVRVGIDIVEVVDVAESLGRFGDGYLQRVFSDAELDSAGDASTADVAARFAAKEAAMKVIGDAESLDWRSIEVMSSPEGSKLRLTGRAAETAHELGVRGWSISTSVTDRYALAVALAAVES